MNVTIDGVTFTVPDGTILVPISEQMVGHLARGWSEPVRIRLLHRDDNLYELVAELVDTTK